MNNAKKKLKKKLIAILITLMPLIIAVCSVGAPIAAVVGFVNSVGSFFSGVFDEIFGSATPDYDNLTLDELITLASDKEKRFFTDEYLKDMMIDSDTFLYLLTKAKGSYRYNNKTINVGLDDMYTKTRMAELSESEQKRVDTEIKELMKKEPDKAKEQFNYYYSPVTVVSTYKISVTLTNEYCDQLGVDWQTLYLLTSYRILKTRVENNNMDIMISTQDVDDVYSLLVPKIEYCDPKLFLTVYSDNSYFSQSTIADMNCKTYVQYQYTDDSGITHSVSGYTPFYGINSIESVYQTSLFRNDGTNVSQYIGSNDILTKFFSIGEDIALHLDFNSYIEQLRQLPGSKYLADQMVYLAKIGGYDFDFEKLSAEE